MCSVEKMLIKGIRSFSPYNEDAITFFKPLTIIVGPNGSGKTTVIECLKQACTGSLPPTCSKQRAAFIHDPKISGQSETRAQIKLRFKDHSNGNPVILIKSFLLTVKGSTSTFKAADQTVKRLDVDTGDMKTYTCKVQDVEKLVPTLMGASQAVLDSVIFVHQDEMNWPLDDPLTVKKKFDSIFNLSGYTKAVDAMRKVRLHNVHEIEKHKLKVGHLKTFVDRSKVLKKEIEADKDSIEQMDSVISKCQQRADASSAEMTELEGKVAAYKSLNKDLEIATNKKEVLEGNTKALFEKIEDEAEEDVDELLAMKSKMEKQLHKYKLQLRSAQEQLESYMKEEQRLGAKFKSNETLESRLFAKIDVNRREIKETREKCRRLAAECLLAEVSQWDESVSNEDIMDNYAAIERKSREKQAKLKSLKVDAKNLEQKLSEGIREAQTQVHKAEDKIKSAAAKKKENLDRVREIEKWQEEVEVSEEEHKKSEAVEKDLNEKLQKVLAKQREAKDDPALKALDADLKSLEERCEALRKEKDLIQENSAKHALFREKSAELRKMKDKLGDLMASNKSKLLDILGVKELPGTEDLVDKVQARTKELEREKDENITEKSRTESKVDAISAQIKEGESAIETLRADRKKKEEMIGNSIDLDSDVDELCKEKEAKLQKLDGQINHMNALGLVFGKYIERTSKSHACPACARPFDGEAEEQSFIQRQKDSKESLPERLEQASKTRDKLQMGIDEMKSKSSLLEDVKRLKAELLDLESKRTTATEARSELLEKMQRLKGREGDLADLLSSARTLLQDVAMPSQNHAAAIKELESVLASDQGAAGLKGSRSLDQVREDLESSEKELKSQLKAKESNASLIMSLNEQAGECERQLREHREIVSTAKGNAIELKTRLKEKEKLEGENSTIDKKRHELARALTEAESALEDVKLDSDRQSRKMQKAVEELEEETYEFLRNAETIKSLCEKLTASDIEKSERQLKRLQQDQEGLKEDMGDLAGKISKAREMIQSEEKSIAERGNLFRNIDDNIAYKKGVEEVRRAALVIKGIHFKMDEFPSGEEMASSFNAAKEKCEEATKKVQYLRGSRKTLETKINERESELKKKEFQNIDQLYHAESIALKTKHLAITDIDSYTKALKKALISFHNRKMTNINKTIKELWQRTYRNSDIDYIQIKYEESGNRGSHNYRVQMISGGTELDMRGRCSAGQRVLASIIIRLALAETFCIDCGILALDEPTTNLDDENARSLALMLQEIIKDRSAQRNFQLIVITHDEKFAQMIGRRTFCEHYWYVHKDENQHSKILRQDVVE